FFGIWLEAPRNQLIERVTKRLHDASDADTSVVQIQFERKVAVTCWAKVDASGEQSMVAHRVKLALRSFLSEA
ncbi:MAG: putative kinase, partial [Hyphomicrobiaceae bacterium]